MNRFLDEVLGQKREEVAAKIRSYRINDLECRASGHAVRDFRAALTGGGTRGGTPGTVIIAEVKRKSPTVARFLQNGDPERLARIYETNGAAAISVVVDERNFGTSLHDVDRIRRVTRLPILAKDFVIDGSQILEARAAGADAVLLIARILSGEMLSHLLGLARRLGISALVECHDEADVEKAVESRAAIIGINNRDLGNLTVSVQTTRRLLPRIPENVIRVSESGITSREDIGVLRSLGVNAFLMGSALLHSNDPGRLLQNLLAPGGQRKGGVVE